MTSTSTSTTNPYKLYIDNTTNNSTNIIPTPGKSFIWNEKEIESLIKIGFKKNKTTDCLELNLTATIPVPYKGVSDFVDSHRPCSRAVKIIKELKEKLIKKLTAKMILIELSKPREIKE